MNPPLYHLQPPEDMQTEHEQTMRSALASQKLTLENHTKATLADKEKLLEKLRDQIQAQHASDRDSLRSNLQQQMEAQTEKHRVESEQLRSEALETALRHQEELSATLETHLSDLSQQRAQLEAANEQQIVLLQEQLALTKGRLVDALSNMTSRQTHEMQSLQKQQVTPLVLGIYINHPLSSPCLTTVSLQEVTLLFLELYINHRLTSPFPPLSVTIDI